MVAEIVMGCCTKLMREKKESVLFNKIAIKQVVSDVDVQPLCVHVSTTKFDLCL